MAPRETENNASAKFWGDKERALWYVMIFSGVFNTRSFGIPGHMNSLATIQQHDYRLIAFLNPAYPLLLLDVNQIYIP